MVRPILWVVRTHGLVEDDDEDNEEELLKQAAHEYIEADTKHRRSQVISGVQMCIDTATGRLRDPSLGAAAERLTALEEYSTKWTEEHDFYVVSVAQYEFDTLKDAAQAQGILKRAMAEYSDGGEIETYSFVMF